MNDSTSDNSTLPTPPNASGRAWVPLFPTSLGSSDPVASYHWQAWVEPGKPTLFLVNFTSAPQANLLTAETSTAVLQQVFTQLTSSALAGEAAIILEQDQEQKVFRWQVNEEVAEAVSINARRRQLAGEGKYSLGQEESRQRVKANQELLSKSIQEVLTSWSNPAEKKILEEIQASGRDPQAHEQSLLSRFKEAVEEKVEKGSPAQPQIGRAELASLVLRLEREAKELGPRLIERVPADLQAVITQRDATAPPQTGPELS